MAQSLLVMLYFISLIDDKQYNRFHKESELISNNPSDKSCIGCAPDDYAPPNAPLASRQEVQSVPSAPEDISDKANNQELAALCKALGHPARVQILKILIARQSCICGEIVEVMPLAQSTVSEHLRILKKAGLVQGDVAGTRICYCVNPVVLNQMKTLIHSL